MCRSLTSKINLTTTSAAEFRVYKNNTVLMKINTIANMPVADKGADQEGPVPCVCTCRKGDLQAGRHRPRRHN